MSLRVGLTGGIASGKTTVSQLFAKLGVTIVDTDVIAREVVAPGTALLAQVERELGPGLIGADGELQRRKLRERVFADVDARRRLEALLHPAIRAEAARQSAAAQGRYHILVIPLLVEGQGRVTVDKVLVVDCPEESQIRRLQARDGGTEAEARAILAAQTSRAQRLAAADDVIVNDGDRNQLATAVASLHKKYCDIAGPSSRIAG
jgi:dephospho-CoA kinase